MRQTVIKITDFSLMISYIYLNNFFSPEGASYTYSELIHVCGKETQIDITADIKPIFFVVSYGPGGMQFVEWEDLTCNYHVEAEKYSKLYLSTHPGEPIKIKPECFNDKIVSEEFKEFNKKYPKALWCLEENIKPLFGDAATCHDECNYYSIKFRKWFDHPYPIHRGCYETMS